MKRISLIFTFLAIFFYTYSQDMFYYSSEKKVPLKIDNSRIAISYPKTSQLTIPQSSGLSVIKTVNGDESEMKIMSVSPSANIESIRKQFATITNVKVLDCYTDPTGLQVTPTGYIYVKLKSQNDYNLLVNSAKSYNCIILHRNDFMPLWYTLRLSESNSENPVSVANKIFESKVFSCSEPDFNFDGLEISYDPDVDKQWGLHNPDYEGIDISASEAWNIATGRGVNIAIVDTGVDMTHIDLVDNLSPKSYDSITKTFAYELYGSHGTHCAGIAAAIKNNGIQIAGVAPDAKIMTVSFSFYTDNVYEEIADGINWAWRNGADVISCSWGCTDNTLVRDALNNAIFEGRGGKGCIIVTSAGNMNDFISFPGNYREEIIAVSNIKPNGITPYAGHGPNMCVCAPGTDILSTLPNDEIGFMTGTSMACPHVSGIAALILERNPALTNIEVIEIIAKSAKKVGHLPYSVTKDYGTWNEYYGYGLADAYNALMLTPRQ